MKWPALPLAVALALMPLAVSLAQEATDETASEPVASLNPLSGLELESLEATRELPLFTPSRKAPVVPEPAPVEVATAPPPPAPPPPPPSPPPLQLIGVIQTGSTDIALLRDRGSSEVIRLSTGEEYDGWSIRFVDSRTVEFQNGDQTAILTMFDQFEAVSDANGFGAGGLPPGFTGAVPGAPPGGPGDEFQFDPQFGGDPSGEDFGELPEGFSEEDFYPDQAFDGPPIVPEDRNPKRVKP
jgi:hypothetical protein